MGERKSKLSQAVLSGSSKSPGANRTSNDGEEGGDITVISRILSKALSRHVVQHNR